MATVTIINGSPVTVESGNGPGRFTSPSPPPSGLTTLMDIINGLTHMALGAVAFTAFAYANLLLVGTSLSQHIYMCVTGYVILMAHGILSISPHTGWARTFNFQQRRMVHMSIHLLGSTLAIVGSIIRIVGKGSPFTTAHGSLGIIAMVFTFLSLIGGILHYFMNLPRLSRTIHYICGSMTITLAFLSLLFAFHNYFRPVFGGNTANAVIILTIFAFVGTLLSACINSTRLLCNKN